MYIFSSFFLYFLSSCVRVCTECLYFLLLFSFSKMMNWDTKPVYVYIRYHIHYKVFDQNSKKKKCMTDSVSDCYSRCFVSFSAQNGVVWCDFIVWSGLTHFLQGKPLNVLTSTPVRVLWSDLKGNFIPFLLWYHLPFHSKKIFLLRHISISIIRIAARHVYTFNITPIQYF